MRSETNAVHLGQAYHYGASLPLDELRVMLIISLFTDNLGYIGEDQFYIIV